MSHLARIVIIPLSSSAGQFRQWHERLKAQIERAEVLPILGDIRRCLSGRCRRHFGLSRSNPQTHV